MLLVILFPLRLLGSVCLVWTMVGGKLCVWIRPALGGVYRGRGG